MLLRQRSTSPPIVLFCLFFFLFRFSQQHPSLYNPAGLIQHRRGLAVINRICWHKVEFLRAYVMSQSYCRWWASGWIDQSLTQPYWALKNDFNLYIVASCRPISPINSVIRCYFFSTQSEVVCVLFGSTSTAKKKNIYFPAIWLLLAMWVEN